MIETEHSRVFGREYPRVAEVRGRYDIGTPIIKKFNDIPYNGNAISNNVGWYKIKHDDDKEEKLTYYEINKNPTSQ